MSGGNRLGLAIVGSIWGAVVVVAGVLVMGGTSSGELLRMILPARLQWWEGTRLLVEVEPDGADLQQTVDRSLRVIERRLYLLGGWATVEQQGPSRIVIRLGPSVSAKAAIALATRRGRLEFRLVDTTMTAAQALAAGPPQPSEVLYDADKVPYLVEKRVWVSGRNVASARAYHLEEIVVRFQLDEDGTRIFRKMTEENVERTLAVVLDGRVLLAPVLKSPILDGMGYISAGFTVEEALELTMMLHGGELPGRLTVVEQRAPPAE